MKKSELRQIIKEELQKEYTTAESSTAIVYALDELESSIQNIKNPEIWAEKYPESARSLIEQIELMVIKLDRISTNTGNSKFQIKTSPTNEKIQEEVEKSYGILTAKEIKELNFPSGTSFTKIKIYDGDGNLTSVDYILKTDPNYEDLIEDATAITPGYFFERYKVSIK